MILDEIKESYFKNEYHNVVGVKLLISIETYRQILKERWDLIDFVKPNESGELPPLFGRPVLIKSDLEITWAWSTK